MAESRSAIVRLRRSLDRIHPRHTAAGGGRVAFGHAGIDAALGGGLARGRLHELLAVAEDAGSAAGFAALLGIRAGRDATPAAAPPVGRPTLWLRSVAVERRAGRLHAAGLRELGLDPAALLLALLPDDAALLRAAADAARCPGLGMVLVEAWGSLPALDLTASRRLTLAAEGSGVPLLLLRIAAEPAPSVADTRWRIAAAPSVALAAGAPGIPMFGLELLRRRAGIPAGPWHVEWDRDRLGFRDAGPAGRTDRGGAPPAPPPDRAATLSGSVLPLAAGGTAAHPPPPRRRAG